MRIDEARGDHHPARVDDPRRRRLSLRTSALEPTVVMRSPLIAIASAHGRRASPVQMRALTTASVMALAVGCRGRFMNTRVLFRW